MGNTIEVRKLIKDLLNNNLLDPYPGVRKGQHFFDEGDGLNLNRRDTFPKGYITATDNARTKSDVGSSGYSIKSCDINIYYFTIEKISYTENNIKYQEGDYVELMLNKIYDYLLNNLKLNDEYHIRSFNNADGLSITDEGGVRSYYNLISFTVYWSDVYGT